MVAISDIAQLYGNHYTWNDGANWTDEEAHLDTVGVTQLQYITALFDRLPWQNLVPDQAHTFVTAGYGTFSTTIGAFANSGTQQFTSPPPHPSDGNDDWVLLLRS
jgi:hypothetical protein